MTSTTSLRKILSEAETELLIDIMTTANFEAEGLPAVSMYDLILNREGEPRHTNHYYDRAAILHNFGIIVFERGYDAHTTFIAVTNLGIDTYNAIAQERNALLDEQEATALTSDD